MFRGYTISKIIFCVFYISHGRYNFVPFLTYRNLLEMLNWLKNDMKYDYMSVFCSVVEKVQIYPAPVHAAGFGSQISILNTV